MAEHTIKIEDGHLRFVYDDELGDLLDEGTVAVCRVSHVEPMPGGKGWYADMRPVRGPVLFANGQIDCDCGEAGQNMEPVDTLLRGLPSDDHLCVIPFETRAEALAAERAWLTAHKGL